MTDWEVKCSVTIATWLTSDRAVRLTREDKSELISTIAALLQSNLL